MRLSHPKQGSNELLVRASSLSVIGVIACLLATSSLEVSAGGEESTQQDKRAREFTEFGLIKRLHSPTRSLDDWRKVGCELEATRKSGIYMLFLWPCSFFHGFLSILYISSHSLSMLVVLESAVRRRGAGGCLNISMASV